MSQDIAIHSPAAPAAPARLFLLFHGVGADAAGLVPLGRWLADAFPDAAVVSVQGPDASDLGGGWQWFSVQGVTEANRAARVRATLPRFEAAVRAWQQRTGVAPEATVLIGFSQGAIMSLAAALQPQPQPPAARIVSLSGRFVQLPDAAPAGVRFHFLHGEQDPVIAVDHAATAAQRLQQLGANVTLDRFPQLGHGISAEVAARLVERLRA